METEVPASSREHSGIGDQEEGSATGPNRADNGNPRRSLNHHNHHPADLTPSGSHASGGSMIRPLPAESAVFGIHASLYPSVFTVILTLITAVSIAIFLWKRRMANQHNHNKKKNGGMVRSRSLEDFEQLHFLNSSHRERSSTFDFFGMNSKSSNNNNKVNKMISSSSNNNRNNSSNRERTSSLDSGVGGGGQVLFDYGMTRTKSATTEFQRERMGSMDLFYSTNNNNNNNSNNNIHQGGRPSSRRNSLNGAVSGANNNNNNTNSHHGDAQDGSGERLLYDEFGLVTLSFRVEYYGPLRKELAYSTWTPPTSWAEASRRIIPQVIMTKLNRTLKLQLQEGRVLVQAPDASGKWDSTFQAEDVSIRIVPPVEGGIMNLYAKGSPREEWTEYTFQSAQEAAQFQLDLIAYQALGKTVHHLFEALNLVHRGSMAYEGPEFVLHDKKVAIQTEETEETSATVYRNDGCVAWDDAMRAMSSIPTIRIALERLWLHHPLGPNYNDDNSKSKQQSPQESSSHDVPAGLIAEEYVNKRLLLGPVDFFRLFVPALPETAFPHCESGRSRMEQLLSWRKRAARAAVLVRSYTTSHRIVNLGWRLSSSSSRQTGAVNKPLTRRLAFDVTDDNNRRDKTSRNEYYEASVSRDVLCFVRPFDYFGSNKNNRGWLAAARFGSSQQRLVLSPYQAYSLVGMHVFKRPTNEDDQSHPLHLSRDPVEALPSLSALIAENPHLDFFVGSFFHQGAVSVCCYVRSLPKGIDPQFDSVMNRFTSGTKEHRDHRMHLMVQLGHNLELSYLGWTVLRILSFLFNLTTKGRESPLGIEATRDRTPFPAIRLSSYSDTHHFGGSLQTNPALPTNYVSMSSSFEPKSMPNYISRQLFTTLEGQLSEHILDFTFAIEGQDEDELPERALCTTRMVNVDTKSVAQEGSSYVTAGGASIFEIDDEDGMEALQTGTIPALHDTDTRIIESPRQGDTSVENEGDDEDMGYPPILDGDMEVQSNSNERDPPLDVAVDDLSQLLDGVQLPVRALLNCRAAETVSECGVTPSNTATILDLINQHDMALFIQSTNFDLKQAAIRIIETTAWRGRTLPIDTRKCRVELQNGQFFQQGFDRDMNPVFYFRNMCLGPWRKDPDAVVAAILHRFDSSLTNFCRTNPNTKCTLVILMGRPSFEKGSTEGHGSDVADDDVDASGAAEADGASNPAHSTNDEDIQSAHASNSSVNHPDASTSEFCNPRIDPAERWQKHTNRDMIHRVCILLSAHYPGRLSKVLVVRGKGKNSYYSTILQGRSAMKQLIPSADICRKVKFIRKTSDLTQYIDKEELVTIVGGAAPVGIHAFQYR